jgi:hypothetical protein
VDYSGFEALSTKSVLQLNLTKQEKADLIAFILGALTRLWRRERSNFARSQSLAQPTLSGAAKQQEDSRKNHCGL